MPHLDYAAYRAREAQRIAAERELAVNKREFYEPGREQVEAKGCLAAMRPDPVPGATIVQQGPAAPAPCLSRQRVQRQVAEFKNAIIAQHPSVLERTTGTGAVLVMTLEDLAALLGFPHGQARMAFDNRTAAVSIVVSHPEMPRAEPGMEMHRILVGSLGDR